MRSNSGGVVCQVHPDFIENVIQIRGAHLSTSDALERDWSKIVDYFISGNDDAYCWDVDNKMFVRPIC